MPKLTQKEEEDLCPSCGMEYDKKEEHENRTVFIHESEAGSKLYECTVWDNMDKSSINPEP